MNLEQFLKRKQTELEAQYRNVQLSSYVSVTFGHRSISEKFTAGNTPLEQVGHEVTREQFPETEFVTLPEENGTHVIFDVVRKGKRKPESAEFYFLWDKQQAAAPGCPNPNCAESKYEIALHKILEEEMPNCDGWETEVVKIAREALGISEEELWDFDPEDKKRYNELIEKYGYNKGVLIYSGMPVDEVLTYSNEDAEAAVEAMPAFL